jgi:hypothetical protein
LDHQEHQGALDKIARTIVNSAYTVHKALGPLISNGSIALASM